MRINSVLLSKYHNDSVNGPIKTVLQKVKMNVISIRECANKITDFHHLVLGVSNICVFRDGYGGCKVKLYVSIINILAFYSFVVNKATIILNV